MFCGIGVVILSEYYLGLLNVVSNPQRELKFALNYIKWKVLLRNHNKSRSRSAIIVHFVRTLQLGLYNWAHYKSTIVVRFPNCGLKNLILL